ncbi:unnamed protein product [Phytophthora lilii]|uniref:Unnamed protein product n=1 Tax=Phytophthora lilii TaxID=2077276 RepID=A0A9W6X2N7_9STRA|nr:unnamed protein product [Phytophthora lilii]
MEEELQLHHLPRYEKKRLVKGWHATLASSNGSHSESSDQQSDSHNNIIHSGSFATPPGALAYDSESWRSTSDLLSEARTPLGKQESGEKLPKTVGQVKQAYRIRARKQEIRDASNAIRKREKFLELRRGPRWRDQDAEKELKADIQEAIIKEEPAENQNEAHTELERELKLIDLPIDDVLTNSVYRDDVLRQIRHHLASGGEVLLQSDCAGSKERILSTRHMLQFICTQSLAYCVRDQNVVPETQYHLQTTVRLVLRLLPRHQQS